MKPPSSGGFFFGGRVKRAATLTAFGLPLLLCVVAAVLWPGVHGPFLFDDYPNLKNLAEINGRLTWRSCGEDGPRVGIQHHCGILAGIQFPD